MFTETAKYLAWNLLKFVACFVASFGCVFALAAFCCVAQMKKEEQMKKDKQEYENVPRPGFNCAIPIGSVYPTIECGDDLYDAVREYLTGNKEGYVSISKWVVRGRNLKISDMSYLFDGLITTQFQNDAMAGIDNWDVQDVTNMFSMFLDCTAFNQPLGSWNVLRVSNASFLFCGCTSFNQTLSRHWEHIGRKSGTLGKPGKALVIGVYHETNVNKKQQRWYMNACVSDVDFTFRLPTDEHLYLYNPRLQ